jgi:hypothetical protein
MPALPVRQLGVAETEVDSAASYRFVQISSIDHISFLLLTILAPLIPAP